MEEIKKWKAPDGWMEWFRRLCRNKLVGAFTLFLCVMVGFTALSRAAASFTVPQVTTTKPLRKVIEHQVSAEGKVEQNLEQAVFTEENQIVETVYVREGQQVAAGDLLFALNTEQLGKTIDTMKQEIEKLKLGNGDLRSQAAVSQRQKDTAKARAQEDYNTAASNGDQAISYAADEWNRARQALQDFLDNSGNAQEGNDAVAEQLAQNCQEQEMLVSQCETALTQLPADAEEAERTACEQKLSDAQAHLEKAQAALEAYQQQQAAAAEKDAQSQRNQLEADVAAKQQAYEEAVKTKEQNLTTAERAIQDAEAGTATDSTATTNEMDMETKQKSVEELQAILDQDGKVTTAVDGVVTKLDITTGGMTAQTAAVTLADLSSGTTFTAKITGEDAKYVAAGSEVTLQPTSGGKSVEGLIVDSILPDTEDAGLQKVTVTLPKGELPIGTNANMKISQKSEDYPLCVPTSALHMDNNQYYVLVLQETEGVLGSSYTSMRIDVSVQDKNAEYAALGEGSITSDNDVIQKADRDITAGGTVRLASS